MIKDSNTVEKYQTSGRYLNKHKSVNNKYTFNTFTSRIRYLNKLYF